MTYTMKWLLALALLSQACAPDRPAEQQLGSEASKKRASALDSRPVATINGQVITVDDFERRLNGMAPYARSRYATIEKRQELLDSMVAFELLAEDAQAKGYADSPAVEHAMKDTMVRLMLADELRERVVLADISPAEVQRAYRERQEKYKRPAQRRAAIIEVADEQTMEQLGKRLDASKELDTKERITAFRKLASRYNLDPSVSSQGGDVGFLPPPDQARDRIEIARRVFTLEQIGDVSAPFKHKNHWFMVMFLEKKAASSKPLEKVTEELRQYLYEQRRHKAREAMIADLKSSKTVTVNKDVLQSIKQPDVAPSLNDLKLGTSPVKDLKPTDP